MRRLAVVLIGLALLPAAAASAQAGEKLMVYTSMKESLIGKLRDAFAKKHPEVAFDYYSAGAGKLMAKVAAERQAGKLTVDVLWHSEVPDFYQLKQESVWEKYVSPEAKVVESTVKDPEGFFTPARLGTLAIAYNTKKVSAGPKSWQDMLDARFKDGFAIANPALSGTAMMSVALLVNTFGWDYIQKLKGNGAKIGAGSGQVVDDTASGDFKASLAPDYIAIDKINKGATMGLAYPKEMLVIPSPIAIFKGTPNLKAAQKFVDFLLSKEGQSIVASEGTLPIRADVAVDTAYGLVKADEAVRRAMKADYLKVMAEKETIIQKFTQIMR
ncbi:MAG TPA: ABC transporter substrate-binding protein [Candidatus Sulfotelmatobacter sp.]|nr:ABC transporter substrate-binding protein [Candidatus Sulfotelmatobacter sp.]